MKHIIILIVLAFWISGCVQNTAIPISARPGDDVILGLGGIHRNSKSSFNLPAAALNVTITDSQSNTFSAKVVRTFRVYPDYTSMMTATALSSSNGMQLVPYDGGWFAVVRLIDSEERPLPLAEGSATLSVVSDKLDNPYISIEEGDLTAIQVEILPPYPEGESQNSQFTSQLIYYQPSSSRFAVRIAGGGPAGVNQLGGAYVVLNYSGLPPGGTLEVLGLPASHNPWIQVGSNSFSNGDGTGYIQAYIMNPQGFISGDERQTARLKDLQIQFLPIYSGIEDNTTVYELDAAASYVIDLEGERVEGLTLELVASGEI